MSFIYSIPCGGQLRFMFPIFQGHIMDTIYIYISQGPRLWDRMGQIARVTGTWTGSPTYDIHMTSYDTHLCAISESMLLMSAASAGRFLRFFSWGNGDNSRKGKPGAWPLRLNYWVMIVVYPCLSHKSHHKTGLLGVRYAMIWHFL